MLLIDIILTYSIVYMVLLFLTLFTISLVHRVCYELSVVYIPVEYTPKHLTFNTSRLLINRL